MTRGLLKLVSPMFLSLIAGYVCPTPARGDACTAPRNAIIAENCLPGNPPSEWDISGVGDTTIQGFGTDISVNKGQTIAFKVKTDASAYRIDIYRIGYYGGNGARKVVAIQPSATLPQTQPACVSDATTGLYDCGNWAVSGSWAVPATAVSGLYIARLVRADNGGSSHIVFIVRDDAGTSDILYQTSAPTWQAYNHFGGGTPGSRVGNNVYGPNFDISQRAYKVSFNRPFDVRGWDPITWFFYDEFPLIRWLERNGYDVSYFTGVDTDRNGSLLTRHKLFISSGHDEYWSGGQRANAEAARGRGVNLAFFSGNEVYWKIRWENSIDGSNTPYRTLVCYKETVPAPNNAKDPNDPPTWTGTWRDPAGGTPADGGRPENGLTGTLFKVNGTNYQPSLLIPPALGLLRFWRNTSVATNARGGITSDMGPNIIGYEWDAAADNAATPAGLIRLSSTTAGVSGQVAQGAAGYPYSGSETVTHSLALYRHASGALVFGAGTINWSWGLDTAHDTPDGHTAAENPAMQQATVNLFADMGVQPRNLQINLVAATGSGDTTPPASSITSPAGGSSVPAGNPVTIAGTAVDYGGGVVASVEVSVDGGTTWHPASGTAIWTYSWTPGAAGSATIKSRATDDSGNVETPGPGVTVVAGSGNCPCSIWGPSTVPGTASANDGAGVELGVKFRASQAGTISGIRFYKGATNSGTHAGNLWSGTGTLLASATFTGETASGWQQVNFSAPVSVAANTTYVASYYAPAGNYAFDASYFASSGFSNGALTALQNGTDGGNGVYKYGPVSSFPADTFNASNYWVDVVYTPAPGQCPCTIWSPSTVPGTASANDNAAAELGLKFRASQAGTISGIRFYKGAGNSGTHVGNLWSGTGTLLASATFSGETAAGWQQATFATPVAIAANTTYVASYFAPAGSYAFDSGYFAGAGVPSGLLTALQNGADGGNGVFAYGPASSFPSGSFNSANYWVDVVYNPAPRQVQCPCSVWSASATPGTASAGDTASVELGLKFSTSQAGSITGIRFYKGSGNTGTHIANLWSATGTLLASATFASETATGWQQVNFAAPVAVTAGATYVASYFAPAGGYAFDSLYFAGSGVTNGPLTALKNGASGGNGVYKYGPASSFPSDTYNSSNYWVDVVFQ